MQACRENGYTREESEWFWNAMFLEAQYWGLAWHHQGCRHPDGHDGDGIYAVVQVAIWRSYYFHEVEAE